MSYEQLELENIFIPAKRASRKLMIVLHGRGDSSEGFAGLPPFLDLEDMNYILLNAPFEYFSGYSWYKLPPEQLPGIEYSSKILTKDLDKLFEKDFDAGESYLFGFSQGALLTFEFGARYHKVLAGYFALSGYIYDTQKLLNEMNEDVKKAKWVAMHRKQEPVLDIETFKSKIKELQDDGFEIEFKTNNEDNSINKEELEYISSLIK